MHKDRIDAALSAIDGQELDAAILFDPASQFYFLGHDSFAGVNTPQALILSPHFSRPSMVIWAADAPMLPEGGVSLDIRHYDFGIDSPAEAIAGFLVSALPPRARLGWDAQSAALNHALASEITAASGLVPIDISELIARLRCFKAPDEIEAIRMAGAMVEHGLAALRNTARAGISERVVASEIEVALRHAGSDYWAVPIEMASGERSHFVHGTPAERVLREGDLLHVEFGAVSSRYHAVGIQTLAIGEPGQKATWLYDVARRCLSSGLGVASPGIPAAEIEAPALDILRSEGLHDTFAMRFGYSVGIGYPPTWLEPFGITRTNHDPVLPGMTLVLHACLLDSTSKLGVLVGGTYTMTEDGMICLAGAGDCDLLQV